MVNLGQTDGILLAEVKLPPQDVTIAAPLVRQLLARQCPKWADEHCGKWAHGWDNEMWRLGDDKLLRLPRRAVGHRLLGHEKRFLPKLCATIGTIGPIRLPKPMFIGKPDKGLNYPYHWMVVDYINGAPLAGRSLSEKGAVQLAQFLKALHGFSGRYGPINPTRSAALNYQGANQERFEIWANSIANSIGGQMKVGPQFSQWRSMAKKSKRPAPVLIHGDLHGLNMLARPNDPETLAAVIDWGDICQGDPATDLAALYMSVDDRAAQQAAFMAYGADPSLSLRAWGWALHFGLMLAAMHGQKIHQQMGIAILERIKAGPIWA